jgi:catechol 2,3-dioxygenase-like lactoylglutathione lyase family enzyme
MLEQICPILPSRNFDKTEAFYASWGFKTWYKQHGQYLLMSRDKVEVHFFDHPKNDPKTNYCGAYLRPDDVDAVSDELAALGLPPIGSHPAFAPAEDKPWGMREAALIDPDGNLIRIGTEIH